MKNLLFLFTVGLLLCGCNRSERVAEKKPMTPPEVAKTNAPAAHALLPATKSKITAEDVPLLEQINRENEKVAAAAVPCIVRVTAQLEGDPHAQFFGSLPFKFPGMQKGVKTTIPSYGSGVIISHDGYVVTNNHVVEESPSVTVELQDHRTFPAKVVAKDAPSDVALLKIEAKDLPALPWGDSDKVEVGDQVFAIGNPFDLDESVSKGIVSAKGRNLPDTANYEGYIQTDAAINVGNSGGALVNIHGELIGINAAIASFTRGSEGVGFSIPSNLVRNAVDQLLKQGKLVRGYLGVRLPMRIEDGVAEVLGLDGVRGALLSGVQHSSPAEMAKLKPVDFIIEVDGHKIDSVPQFRLIVSQIPVGKLVKVTYIRSGETKSATVKIAELPMGLTGKTSPIPDGSTSLDTASPLPAVGNVVLNGIQITELNDSTRKKFGVDDIVPSGVVVTGVQDGSPADAKGLIRGDVIEIACPQRGAVQELGNVADFTGLAKVLKSEQSVVLLVHHGKTSGGDDGTSTFVCLTPVAGK